MTHLFIIEKKTKTKSLKLYCIAPGMYSYDRNFQTQKNKFYFVLFYLIKQKMGKNQAKYYKFSCKKHEKKNETKCFHLIPAKL